MKIIVTILVAIVIYNSTLAVKAATYQVVHLRCDKYKLASYIVKCSKKARKGSKIKTFIGCTRKGRLKRCNQKHKHHGKS